MTRLNRESVGEAEKTYGFLRDKIKSKLDVAKLLGTFLTGIIGVLLGTKSDTIAAVLLQLPAWAPLLLLAGIAFTVMAIVLFFATVIAYDRLLMPFRYWRQDKPRDNDAMQRLMVQASQRLFVPAGFCSAVGLLLLLSVLLKLSLCLAFLIAGATVLTSAAAFLLTRKPEFPPLTPP